MNKRLITVLVIFLTVFFFGSTIQASDSNHDPFAGGYELFPAIRADNYEKTKELIERGVGDVNSIIEGKSVLMEVVISGNLEIARLLLEAGANVNTRNTRHGTTALEYAIANLHKVERKSTAMIELLISYGADVNVNAVYYVNGTGSRKRTTPIIIYAIMESRMDVIKILLDSGADLSAKSPGRHTALTLAIKHNNEELMKIIMDKLIANGNYASDMELIFAAAEREIDIIKGLLDSGIDINFKAPDGTTALIAAMQVGDINMVRFLVKNGADVTINVPDDTYLKRGRLYASLWEKDYPGGMGSITWAVLSKDVDLLRLFIEKGADVNAKDVEVKTAIERAISRRDMEMLHVLIENGADINTKDWSGNTLLILAATKGRTEMVRLLIEKGADVNARSEYGRTPLTLASESGHTDIVRLLINAGAKVGAVDNKTLSRELPNGHANLLRENGAKMNMKSSYGPQALSYAVEKEDQDLIKLVLSEKEKHARSSNVPDISVLAYAAKNGYTDLVKLLIENDANVDLGTGTYLGKSRATKSKYSDTPLMYSLKAGHLDIAELLIEGGANINAGTRYGILHWWLDEKHSKRNKEKYPADNDVIPILIKAGADVNTRHRHISRPTLLMRASEKRLIDAAKLFIDAGADLEARNKDDDTVLISASQSNRVRMVRLLIKEGADLNAIDHRKDTALIKTVIYNNATTLMLLIEAGADMEAKNKNDDSALMLTLSYNRKHIAGLLIKHGVDVNAKDNRGDTAIIRALKYKKASITELFIDAGADMEARNKNGDTALMWALIFNKANTVHLLIKKGADVNAKNNDGTTPLIIANRNNYTELAELLKAAGAKE